MGKPKGNKVRKEKLKNGSFTKYGFVKRLMDSGWNMKEALEEWKRVRIGVYND